MATLRLSRRAQRQLIKILDYLDANAGYSISRQHEADFDDLFERLTQTPTIGANRPELGKNMKLSMVTRYLVYHRYHADRDEVEVAIIRDGSRRQIRRTDFS